jgi:predicted NAD-dependent protein-ADP-ribosyltransferase YbiA (DUF1768 family)
MEDLQEGLVTADRNSLKTLNITSTVLSNAPSNAPSNATSNAPTETAPAPEDTPTSLTEYITTTPPYSDDVVKRIKTFFKNRAKNPRAYTYGEAGDLVIFSKSGSQEDTIALKSYVNHDMETLNKRDASRLDAIGAAETEYETAFKKVRETYAAFKRTGVKQPFLAAQKAMADADALLSRVRYGSRSIQSIANPEVRDVLFDQPYEERKLISEAKDPFKKELARLIVLEYPYMDFYGTYVEAADVAPTGDADAVFEEVGISEALVRQTMKNGQFARIFFESEEGPNGFLSPFWPVEYTLEDAKYFTGLQAYEVLRAEEAGNLELKKSLMGTRSTRTMRFLTKKLVNQPKVPKDVWLQIFTAIYQQNPILKQKLLATGTDRLIFADLRKGPSGTGLGERDAGNLTQSKWLYENAVGAALEALRYQFREGSAAESAINASPSNAVISTDEQSAAKVAAIINTKKKFQFKR